jgi:hypothetical protein
MSTAELLHTFKMMGVTVTPEEFRSLQELLPSSAVSKEGSIDYRELFWIIQTQTTHGTQFYPDTDASHRFNFPPRTISFPPSQNASNPFSPFTPIPGNKTRYLPELDTVGYDKSVVSTPIGTFMTTPLKSDSFRGTRESYTEPPQRKHESIDILTKVKAAIIEKSRQWGTKFHLQKQFEVYDGELSGYVPLVIFQTILEDLSVPLSGSDIYAIRSRYARTGDIIDYLEFCQDLKVIERDREVSKHTLSSAPHPASIDRTRTLSSRSFLPPASRLAETLRSLRNSGRDPRDIFQAYDLDNTGMVFGQLVHSVQQPDATRRLISEGSKKLYKNWIFFKAQSNSPKQSKIIDASPMGSFLTILFAHLSRNLICYEDFCHGLEKHISTVIENFNPRHPKGSEEMLETWYQTATPREQQEISHVFDSLDRYRATMEKGNEFESSSYLPPKPSESISRLRFNKTTLDRGFSHPHREGIASSYHSSYSPRYASPLRPSTDRLSASGGSLQAPRSPPSKVGSVMWGNETPLSRKGLHQNFQCLIINVRKCSKT